MALAPDSGTYGELPPYVAAMIEGHVWDNKTREEQRQWLIAALNDVMKSLRPPDTAPVDFVCRECGG